MVVKQSRRHDEWWVGPCQNKGGWMRLPNYRIYLSKKQVAAMDCVALGIL